MRFLLKNNEHFHDIKKTVIVSGLLRLTVLSMLYYFCLAVSNAATNLNRLPI